jgi:NAD(P)-dependent dehydrogenase (short-subunit alcohol dehydrogenase family)
VSRLEGRVCLVTGATGGMGAAIVGGLVAAGASVVATDRAADALATLAAPHGDAVAWMAADLANAGVAEQLVELATTTFGRLDAAVNAAGIENEVVPLHLTTDAAFDRLIDINVRAVFRCMRAEIAAMLAGGTGGSIVNIASTNSFRPQHDQPAYTASKHAVLGLTRSAALDYGTHGIRVNAICPGAIDTPMLRGAMERRGRDADEVARRLTRFGRFGTPEEIAAAAVWLCSDESSFTTGHALAVDGGMLGT